MSSETDTLAIAQGNDCVGVTLSGHIWDPESGRERLGCLHYTFPMPDDAYAAAINLLAATALWDYRFQREGVLDPEETSSTGLIRTLNKHVRAELAERLKEQLKDAVRLRKQELTEPSSSDDDGA